MSDDGYDGGAVGDDYDYGGGYVGSTHSPLASLFTTHVLAIRRRHSYVASMVRISELGSDTSFFRTRTMISWPRNKKERVLERARAKNPKSTLSTAQIMTNL